MLDMIVAARPPQSLEFTVADFSHLISSVFFAVFFSLRLMWLGLFIPVCRQALWQRKNTHTN